MQEAEALWRQSGELSFFFPSLRLLYEAPLQPGREASPAPQNPDAAAAPFADPFAAPGSLAAWLPGRSRRCLAWVLLCDPVRPVPRALFRARAALLAVERQERSGKRPAADTWTHMESAWRAVAADSAVRTYLSARTQALGELVGADAITELLQDIEEELLPLLRMKWMLVHLLAEPLLDAALAQQHLHRLIELKPTARTARRLLPYLGLCLLALAQHSEIGGALLPTPENAVSPISEQDPMQSTVLLALLAYWRREIDELPLRLLSYCGALLHLADAGPELAAPILDAMNQLIRQRPVQVASYVLALYQESRKACPPAQQFRQQLLSDFRSAFEQLPALYTAVAQLDAAATASWPGLELEATLRGLHGLYLWRLAGLAGEVPSAESLLELRLALALHPLEQRAADGLRAIAERVAAIERTAVQQPEPGSNDLKLLASFYNSQDEADRLLASSDFAPRLQRRPTAPLSHIALPQVDALAAPILAAVQRPRGAAQRDASAWSELARWTLSGQHLPSKAAAVAGLCMLIYGAGTLWNLRECDRLYARVDAAVRSHAHAATVEDGTRLLRHLARRPEDPRIAPVFNWVELAAVQELLRLGRAGEPALARKVLVQYQDARAVAAERVQLSP